MHPPVLQFPRQLGAGEEASDTSGAAPERTPGAILCVVFSACLPCLAEPLGVALNSAPLWGSTKRPFWLNCAGGKTRGELVSKQGCSLFVPDRQTDRQ
eukprot:SAG22_NODE_451_length_10354_cov_5.184983_1_plen_98_part_00